MSNAKIPSADSDSAVPSEAALGQSVKQLEAGRTGLKANALGFPSVAIAAFTAMGPGAGVIFILAFTASLAGVIAPLAFFVAFLIVLSLGVSLAALAKHLPSAGGYFTYVSRAIGPRTGFVTAWMFYFNAPFGIPFSLAFAGYITQQSLQAGYGVDFPWWLFTLIAIAVITALSFFGISISTKVVIALAVFEVMILTILAIFGIVNPGPGGVSLAPLNPAHIGNVGINSFLLAVIFAVAAFTGFEEVVSFAEESRNPRRTLPFAIVGAIVLGGLFFVFVPFGIIVGWGTSHISSLAAATNSPVIVFAKRAWGAAWILILFVAINSTLASMINWQNSIVRTWFAVARAGALPRFLAVLHRRWKTPVNAIILQLGISLIVAIGLGFAMGPSNLFFYFAVQITLALLLVYVAGNIAAMVYYRRERRAEFNVWLHLIFPVVSTAGIGYLFYKTIIPLPVAPARWAPVIVLGWLIVGIVLSRVASSSGRERWLAAAGRSFGDDADQAGTLADVPSLPGQSATG